MEDLDIVIPVASKDLPVLPLCMDSVRNFINKDAEFYIIANDSTLDSIDDEIFTVRESYFEFSVDDIKNAIKHKGQAGWYWQQIMQFYLWDVLPELGNNILFVNSDVIFLKPILIIDRGLYVLNYHNNQHEPYAVFTKRLFPDFELNFGNGTCHYMVYDKDIVLELRGEVEKKFNMPFWKAFCNAIDDSHINGSSEFYLYFQYCLNRHPEKIETKKLLFVDKGDYWNWKEYQKQGYDYAAFHAYMRNK
jgi:hypothetical protein